MDQCMEKTCHYPANRVIDSPPTEESHSSLSSNNNDALRKEQVRIWEQIQQDNHKKRHSSAPSNTNAMSYEDNTRSTNTAASLASPMSVGTGAERNASRLLQEQFQILEQIQNKNRLQQQQQQCSMTPFLETTTQHQRDAGLPQDNPEEEEEGNRYSQDCVTKLQNGTRVRIRGTRHAARAATQGNAIFHTCPHCQACLQISSTTRKVFCTLCSKISLAAMPTDSLNQSDCS